LTDAQGLAKAYNNINNIFINGNTMFISGTHPNKFNTTSDYVTDLAIPFSDLSHTNRAIQANNIYNLHKNNITTIVSHSLGSSISETILMNNKSLKGVLYSSPTGRIKRPNVKYRSHYFDPVTTFNNKTEQSLYFGNPHSYSGY
jgi:hypothetical protein